MLAASILGLALAEQLFRNTPASARWAIKPLCLGLAAVFVFDLFVFSDALMLRHLDHDLWSARGITHALAIPFLALSAVRNRHWTIEVHVSRQVMFHSTAVLASGVYLLAVAAAGYYVRLFGGDWGKAIQAIFLFAALLLLAWLFFSGTVRAKLRVFVNKHFYSYRYDYREEWLRFIRLLSTPDPQLGLQERCVKALADLVESPGGGMWVKRTRGFVQTARWNFPEMPDIEPSDSALAQFLERRGWVINIPEFCTQPERYDELAAPALFDRLPAAWLIVPLFSGDELLGFIVLSTPRIQVEVNWEVRDLLKTAARQVGTFVAQLESDEALLEARKFDAFNRMSAFVVHDLKNLVAQLSLMLKNAERHRDNPAFQADMLETVGHVTSRMNSLLLQLRSGTTPVSKPGLVDLAPVARRIGGAKAAQGRTVSLEVGQDVFALGHEDRLERVVGHLVQNALDATPDTGRVTLRVYPDGDNTVVEVWDTGQGMSPEFVKNSLFKPFQTTKSTGMGIGFYESAQYIQDLGGNIAVDSKLGAGTRVTVAIPRHSGAVLPSGQTRAAA
jgi:putative PEP-CTERM system histidine kinase